MARSTAPVLVKHGAELEWLDDERVFYVLTKDGLMLCRNHPFFKSCVRAPRGPSGLGAQEEFLELGFPRIPQRAFEVIVAFFDHVGFRHGAEATVLLYWDPGRERVRVVCPPQTATVTRYSDGYQHPIGLHYTPPVDLPRTWIPFGDVHSHVDLAAYASATDQHDEMHSAGLHVVVGKLYQEPPDVHQEAVVDGARFRCERADAIEGYARRARRFPRGWLALHTVEATPSWSWSKPGGAYGAPTAQESP